MLALGLASRFGLLELGEEFAWLASDPVLLIVAPLLPEMHGLLQWGTAALLGGGAAGIVQGTTVLARGASTASTGGLGNPLVATKETGGSLLTIAFALLIPTVFGVLVILALAWLFVRMVRLLRDRRNRRPAPGT